MSNKPVVAAFFGIPASGKTTLVDQVVQDMLKDSDEGYDHPPWFPCVIRYDSVMSLKEQEQMSTCSGLMKRVRQQFLSAAEALIAWVLGKSTTEKNPLWQSLRSGITRQAEPGERPVFLVDDNLYYRSMRHEWFTIAQKMSLCFCQVFVACPVEEAVKRNAMRPCSVPETVVRRMEERLEPPGNRYWEQACITAHSLPLGSRHSYLLRAILDCPEAPCIPSTADLSADPSLLHMWDLALRRAVTVAMKDLPRDASVSLEMCRVRRQILAWARSEGSALSSPPNVDALVALLQAHTIMSHK
ncbi:L-seryl-tRNA(Sec) kinase-like [Ornithodoros turicata]|uniref:L-seryl-tRNA(Sec) kinase-like n=1 Tax=Ornithodoros turicata TaxID=34597 RepID=UPI0031399CDF